MRTFLIFVLTINMIFLAKSQNSRLEITELGIFSAEDYSQAKVYLNQESILKGIIISKTAASKSHQAWKIQIYMGSGKNARSVATSTRNSFLARYPDIGAEVVYPSPYFKVQAGNFKTRIEAESFRKKILGEYPNCRVELVVFKND